MSSCPIELKERRLNEKKPYLINGIIGNSSILASLGENGQIYRLYWPNIDLFQHLGEIRTGIFIEGNTDKTLWTDDTAFFKHKQYYIKDTNILCTECFNNENSILIKSTDFAVPNKDLLIRKYSMINKGLKDIKLKFIFYMSMYITENSLYNAVSYNVENDSIVYYRNNYMFMLSSTDISEGFQGGNAYEDAEGGNLSGNVSSLGSEGALSYNFLLKSKEQKEISFYLICAHSYSSLIEKHKQYIKYDPNYLEQQTLEYWKSFLYGCKLITTIEKEQQEVYKRSILAIKLLTDYKSGSISAAPEVDETYSKSGGYNYCWIRDGSYICNALTKVNLSDLCKDFYRWAAKIQSPNGSWLQRYYHNGNLAPSWGFQVDEGATLIWSLWEFYLKFKDINFLKELWPTIEKGCDFLLSYIDSNYLAKPSYDLWEERVGQHTYSTAAIAAALKATYNISEVLSINYKRNYLIMVYNKIKNSIYNNLWNSEKGYYLRSVNVEISKEKYIQYKNEGRKVYEVKVCKGYNRYITALDDTVDSSLLGLSYPFNLFSPNDDHMKLTADAIEKKLWTSKVGGIKRYENDEYIGGNPWIITTLWLAIFRLKQGQTDKAKELLNWVLAHKTTLDLLPEQIDKNTGEPAWVVPLIWSHGMYLLCISEFHKFLNNIF